MFKLYRSPELSKLLTPPGVIPEHIEKSSALSKYIGTSGTGYFEDWVNYAREVRYALVSTTDSIISAIDADPDITPLSPSFSSLAAFDPWLDESGVEFKVNQDLKNMLEADGMPTSWITGLNTRRDVFRYLSKLHIVTREMQKIRKTSEAIGLLKNNAINSALSSASNEQRNDFDLFAIDKKGSAHGLPNNAKISQAILDLILHDTVASKPLGQLKF